MIPSIPRSVAIDPKTSDVNDFVARFSKAITDIGFNVEPLDWKKLGHRRFDIIILHWPNEFFCRSSRSQTIPHLWRLWWSKLRYGSKIVWVAHNLRPHEGEDGWPIIQSLFLRAINGIIFLSRFSQSAVNALYKPHATKQLVTVHGLYDAKVPVGPRPATATVGLLFFGQIRRYKNLEALITAAREAPITNFSLSITGACRDESYRAELLTLAGDDPRIIFDLRDGHLSELELERKIDASDAVVLPYKAILNSGAVLHALSRARAVLAPAVGSLPEVAEQVGPRWLQLYEGDLSGSILSAFVNSIGTSCSTDRPDLTSYGWDRITEDLRGFIIELGKK